MASRAMLRRGHLPSNIESVGAKSATLEPYKRNLYRRAGAKIIAARGLALSLGSGGKSWARQQSSRVKALWALRAEIVVIANKTRVGSFGVPESGSGRGSGDSGAILASSRKHRDRESAVKASKWLPVRCGSNRQGALRACRRQEAYMHFIVISARASATSWGRRRRRRRVSPLILLAHQKARRIDEGEKICEKYHRLSETPKPEEACKTGVKYRRRKLVIISSRWQLRRRANELSTSTGSAYNELSHGAIGARRQHHHRLAIAKSRLPTTSEIVLATLADHFALH